MWMSLIVLWLVLVYPLPGGALADEAGGYVGRATCQGCHADQDNAWKGSHHDRAMEDVSPATVLGDFADVVFSHDGTDYRFFRRGDAYLVRTLGADGEARDFKVRYTFGVDPLQQYLLELEDGRLQALFVAWDTRPREQGGQRWFHLYPDETIPPGDWLHWTGPFHNWNARCASCHSTNLRKNYDLASRSYATTWSEIDVSCEACHGPGQKHVAWAGSDPATRSSDRGLSVAMDTAQREIESCAPCHSRRHAIAEPAKPGARFLDSYVENRIEEDLYFADGQIDDEVYVYGSFLQSKMHAAGVRCSDCHDPHSARVRLAGNALCVQCHNPGGNTRFPGLQAGDYDTPQHHRHSVGSAAARCVSCHMPSRTYMVIDDRRDHSFRIPRPDLSEEHGVPNACQDCHVDRDAKWAATAVGEWFGEQRQPHWTAALAAGRKGTTHAPAALAKLAADRQQPGIVRATAVELLPRFGPAAALEATAAVADADPLVRAMAGRAFDSVPLPQRQAGLPLLRDPVLAVRIETARAMAGLGEALPAEFRADLERAIADYRKAQRVNLDTPEAHLNLALMHGTLGELAEAQAEYETAIQVGPYFIPAYVNLADLHRVSGREQDAERVLRSALQIDGANADVQHALGLSLVRQQRTTEGIELLKKAAESSPEVARYAFTYGIALHSTGKPTEALAVLQAAHQRHPTDADILSALVGIHRERGELWDALLFARKLGELMPQDPNLRAMIAALEAQAAGPRK